MIAEIIPIKRLPRRFRVFDYIVPETLIDTIQPGQLVTIPLKSSEVFGLVFSLKETSESPPSSLKQVNTIVHEEPIVAIPHLSALDTWSSWYGVALGTLANMMLLPMQKRKLAKVSLLPFPPEKKQSQEQPFFHLIKDEGSHATTLHHIVSSSPAQIAIIVPEIQYIEEITSALREWQDDLIEWHSGLSTKEQFDAWLAIRNGKKRIIVGTRGAILLPYFDLSTIVLDYEQKDNHKHWDQAPRFHTKDIASYLHDTRGIDFHLLSSSPSADTYFYVHKGIYRTETPLQFLPQTNAVTTINMTDERKGGNTSPISTALEDALTELTGNAFLYLNRLGLATFIGCNECNWRARCHICELPNVLHTKNKQLTCHYCHTTTPLPLVCPACNGSVVSIAGVGTETIEMLVRDLAKDHNLPHAVVRLDSESREENFAQHTLPTILIGTDTAFSSVLWEKTELISFIDADQGLAIPEYTAEEQVWHKLQDVCTQKKADATFLIQTRDKEHLVFKSLREPERMYRTDLNHRMKLGYPPYTYLVRYFFGHANFLEAKKTMEVSQKVLANRIRGTHRHITLSESFEMHPRYYRGRHWFCVLAKLSVDTWQEDLVWLNSHIPDTWKIDPHPISILSP